VDVAHLYEDATIREASEERLVLLCSNHNQAQARLRHRQKAGVGDELHPVVIQTLALRRYWSGRYAGAYASSRLAAYLFERQAQYPKSARCLIEAMSALRPVRWGDLIRATLLEFERLCASYDVGLTQRWLFLDRLALVLYDFRKWDKSVEILSASHALRKKLRADQRDPAEAKFDLKSSFRREAMIQASVGRAGRRQVADLVKRLTKDAEVFHADDLYDAYATNLDVAARIELEILGNTDRATELGERVLVEVHRVSHKWVLQEHYWRLAGAYAEKGDRTREVESVVEALRVYHDAPVVLEPMLSASGPVRHDPIADLEERRGITAGYLQERGVAPSRKPPREIPLRLRDTILNRIVKSALDGP
jgi:hypothetical protein